MLKGCRVGFIGGGNMAEAIIRGLLAGGVTAAELVVAEPMAERREFLREPTVLMPVPTTARWPR